MPKDKTTIADIKRIMHCDARPKCWPRGNHSSKKRKGGGTAFLIKVKYSQGEVGEYKTEEKIIVKVGTHIANRFWLNFMAQDNYLMI